MVITIKAALSRRRMWQFELARELKLTETRLSRICSGRVQPTNEEKEGIARALGMRVEDLFADSGPPVRSST